MLANIVVPWIEVDGPGPRVARLGRMLVRLFGVRLFLFVRLGRDRLATIGMIGSARLLVAARFRRIQAVVVMLAFLGHASVSAEANKNPV